MGILKKIGWGVIGLSVLIGSVGKYVPHWFLSLPFPLSIMLWISTGHEMPPYFMFDMWKDDEVDTWTRDGDLIVAVGAKSGTTFMLYCAHQIRTKGTDVNDELFPDASISTPWPELRQSRAGTWADQKDRLNTTVIADGRKMKDVWDHPSYPFRIFKSHYFPPELPVRRKGGKKLKFIAMSRNGIDMAASMTNFFTAHTEKFRKLWGGFPPAIPGDAVNADEPPPAVKDLLPGGPIGHFYFGYIKRWWPYRSDPNVLFLHYSDVRKDLKIHVVKLAKFLEVDLTDSELETVTERCSIEHMKEVNRFNYLLPLNQDKGLWDAEKDALMYEGSLMKNGGQVGQGASMFSEKVVQMWKKAEEDEFGHDPAMLKWAREGGEYPPA